jgi:hypothetical protein
MSKRAKIFGLLGLAIVGLFALVAANKLNGGWEGLGVHQSDPLTDGDILVYDAHQQNFVTRHFSTARAPQVDVRDYGAICDGVTDNRDAINAAVQAGAGGTIFFPKQTNDYRWDPQLDLPVAIPNNTKLIFAPGAAIRFSSAFAGNCNAIFTNTTPCVDPDIWGVDHDIEIDGLTMYSPTRPNTNPRWYAAAQPWLSYDATSVNGDQSVMYGWLSFKGVRRVKINHLKMSGMSGVSVHFSRARDIEIHNTEFNDCLQDLLHFSGWCFRVHIKHEVARRSDTTWAVTAYDWMNNGNPDGPSGDFLIEDVDATSMINPASLLEPGDFGTNANEVQKLDFTGASGTFTITVQEQISGELLTTGAITYSGTAATLVSRINTALDALLLAGQVVASGSNINNIALTFSGSNFKNTPINPVTVAGTTCAISRTTPGWRANHDITNITVRNQKNNSIECTISPDTGATVPGTHTATAGAVNNLTIENMSFDNTAMYAGNTLNAIEVGFTGGAVTVNGLTIRGTTIAPSTVNSLIRILNSGVVNNLTLDGYRDVPGAGTAPQLIVGTGTVNGFTLCNSRFDRTGNTNTNELTGLTGTINRFSIVNTTFLGFWLNMFVTRAGQTINDFVVDGVDCSTTNAFVIGNAYFIRLVDGAFNRVRISNSRFDTIDAVIRTDIVTPLAVVAGGNTVNNVDYFILPFPGAITARASNNNFTMRVSAWRCVGATASMVWFGANNSFTTSGGVGSPNYDTKDAGQTTRIIDTSMEIDLTQSVITEIVGDQIRDKADHKVKMCTTAPGTFTAVAASFDITPGREIFASASTFGK